MYSNLVKSYFTKEEGNGPRIIDTNDIIAEKIERLKAIMPIEEPGMGEYDSENALYDSDMVDGEMNPDAMNVLFGDMPEDITGDGEPEFATDNVFSENVIKATPVSGAREMLQPEIDAARDKMMYELESEVNALRNAAESDILQQKTLGYDEGKKQGYQDGMAAAQAEIQKAYAQVEAEKAKMWSLYEEKVADLEPEFVRVLTNIYERVFRVDFAQDKALIVHMLHNAMQRIESSKNYLIHVSREDYPYVSEHKDELMCAAMTEDTIIDLVEDVTMKKGDCMIETEGGIFDCGIDTQLEGLKKRLTLLSYDGRD